MRHLVLLLLSSCAAARVSVQETSVDIGVEHTDASYPYAGITVPIGPLTLSGGAWMGLDRSYGPFVTLNKSWLPFAPKESAVTPPCSK